MKERIAHIFESSTCLTKRQVTDYVNKTMSREECLAAEHHINSCGFCSAALDGLTPQILKNMDNGFLKEHLSLIRPQVHLSSIAPTASGNLVQRRPKKNAKAPLVKTSSVTAALLLGFGVLWYLQYGSKLEPRSNNNVVQKSVPVTAVSTGAKLSEHTPAEVSVAQPAEKVVVTEASFHPATQPEQQRPHPLITTKPSEEQATASKTEKPEANSAIETEKNAIENNSDIPAAIPKPAALPVKEEHRVAPPKASSKNEEQSPQELYESGKYGAALNIYKKQMSSNGSRSEQEAALQAANCYLKLGQKDNAVKLMQSLVETGNGSPRRQAKRLLKDLEKSEAE
jgi:FimV-like protein